jgi:hypothetical protein
MGERAFRPIADVVNRSCDEVLSGSSLSGKEHRGSSTRRDALQERLDALHHEGVSDNGIERSITGAWRTVVNREDVRDGRCRAGR